MNNLAHRNFAKPDNNAWAMLAFMLFISFSLIAVQIFLVTTYGSTCDTVLTVENAAHFPAI